MDTLIKVRLSHSLNTKGSSGYFWTRLSKLLKTQAYWILISKLSFLKISIAIIGSIFRTWPILLRRSFSHLRNLIVREITRKWYFISLKLLKIPFLPILQKCSFSILDLNGWTLSLSKQFLNSLIPYGTSQNSLLKSQNQ